MQWRSPPSETPLRLGETMAALNAGALRAMRQVGADACADVTGFGLPGHLQELVRNNWVDVVRPPPHVRQLASQEIIPTCAYSDIIQYRTNGHAVRSSTLLSAYTQLNASAIGLFLVNMIRNWFGPKR